MRGHVRKRGSGWAIVVELETDPISGKRRQKWVSGFRTKTIAERELRRRLRLIDEGEDAFPDETSVEAFVLERWLPHLDTQGRLRAGTIRNYRQLMRDHILPHLGHMQLRKVRPGHVQTVLDEMTRSGRAGRTVSHARAAMSSAFTSAVRWQLVAINPVRATEAPAKKVLDLHVPSAAELITLMEAARGTGWEVPIMLAATTGARRGEVRWGNVDLERGRIRIVEALQRVNRELVYAPPKTPRAVRSIPIPGWVTEALRRHRSDQAQRLLVLGIRVGDNHPVADRGDGEPLDPSTFTHAVSRIATAAGLEGVRLHDLRHAVATILAATGNSPAITSKILGHASVAFTLQTYTHPDEEELVRAAAALERALGSR
jgi:integrase